MGKVIKMDLYRLNRSLSFKICLFLVFALNLTDGPILKILFNIAKRIAEKASDSEELAELGEWNNTVHVGNVLTSNAMGVICTSILLVCVVIFCYADIRNGYIKNIAGQLSSRGHTIVSKFMAIQFAIIVFYFFAVAGNLIGNLVIGGKIEFNFIIGSEDHSEVRSMGVAFGEFAIKWLLLSAICAVILLFTVGIGSNVAGTIVAVLCGGGFASVAYTAISYGIIKLLNLKEFDLSKYMPDSLLLTEIISDNSAKRALAVAIGFIIVLMYLTTTLYNKKDIE